MKQTLFFFEIVNFVYHKFMIAQGVYKYRVRGPLAVSGGHGARALTSLSNGRTFPSS